MNTNFFLSNFSGHSGISRQNPGISRPKDWFPWVPKDIPNFWPPPVHPKISGPKSLGLGAFFSPDCRSLHRPQKRNSQKKGKNQKYPQTRKIPKRDKQGQIGTDVSNLETPFNPPPPSISRPLHLVPSCWMTSDIVASLPGLQRNGLKGKGPRGGEGTEGEGSQTLEAPSVRLGIPGRESPWRHSQWADGLRDDAQSAKYNSDVLV